MIRELQHDDLPELLQLYRQLNPDDAPLPAAEVVDAVWQSIQGNPDLLCLGAFVGASLVSTCTLSIIPNLTRSCRPYGLIENVVTDSAHRRAGHGRDVLTHALDLAWSRECYKVMLLTGSKDEGKVRFYESAGFDRQAKQAFLARPVEEA